MLGDQNYNDLIAEYILFNQYFSYLNNVTLTRYEKLEMIVCKASVFCLNYILNNIGLIISLQYLITHKEYCWMFVGMKHIARAALHPRREKIPSRPLTKSLVIPHLLFDSFLFEF